MTNPQQTKNLIHEYEALKDYSAEAWIDYHEIKNEKGEPIEWEKHQFLRDIYDDQADNLVVKKAAQVGMSTLEVLKNFRDAEVNKMDIIYTLPTDGDVGVFVGGKVNRFIANNPYLQKLVKDSDSIEKKQVKDSMIYFRGTWTKKAAIMVTADRLVHDEKDSSKQDVISDYQARLQHSKFKHTHVFSHPSIPNFGVDIEWQKSDQKEWFITCPHCQFEQYMEWDTENEKRMSVDIKNKKFICKKCRGEIHDEDRATGRWKARYSRKNNPNIIWSGYHISLLMAPWISAKYIIEKYNEVLKGNQTMDFFYNKILGEPYAGGDNTVDEETIKGLWTPERNFYNTRLVIGVDTGKVLHYVAGNKQGLVNYGIMKDYMPDSTNKLQLHETLEYWLIKFPESIMVIDQGGDIIGSRKLREKYPGRVYLCHYARDRKTMQLWRWGDKEESGNVLVDRNRTIQLIIDEAKDRRFKLYGGSNREDWHQYWLHWHNIYRVVEEDSLGPRYVWERSDRDDYVHATVYWRVGIDRFGGSGFVSIPSLDVPPDSYIINSDETADFNPDHMFGNPKYDPEAIRDDEEPWWVEEEKKDWRDI